MVNQPPVGYPVQYLPSGDAHEPAVAAVVAQVSGPTLRLLSWSHHGGEAMRRQCRHVDDPFLREHPARKFKEGAWRFVPGLDYRVDEACDPTSSEIDQIFTLRDVGNNASEIAVILGGDWTHQKVNGILKRKAV